MYEQKQSPIWWTGNIRVFIYFLRELSGIVIAAYVFCLVLLADVSVVIHWIALVFTLIHVLTWLFVMTKIVPKRFEKLAPPVWIAYPSVLIAWAVITYLLLTYVYV